MSKIENYIGEAIDNIREDRDKAKEFLEKLENLISVDDQSHSRLGSVAAKYLETLQRSNEQLVKVAALLQKKQEGSNNLTIEDKDEIFEMIKGGK